MLLLIKDTRQQQAAFQHGNLLFNIALGLQSTIEPGLHFDVALNQLITRFRCRNEPFAQLVINVQLLLDQRVCLNTGRFVRRNRFLSRLFRQRQALAIHRFLQQLKLMLQSIAVSGDVVTLLLQGILQHRVAFQAFTLLIYLCIQQGLLRQQQILLGRT